MGPALLSLAACIVLQTVVAPVNGEKFLLREGFSHPSPEFSRYNVVRPAIFNSKSKEQLTTTRKHEGSLEHVHDLTMKLSIDGKEQTLDLQLNRNLIPANHFVRHQENGSHVLTNPSSHEVELCHYYGDIRGEPGSWAALSTCNGIRGMVHDGKRPHYIERSPSNSGYSLNENLIYDHDDLVANHTCGFDGTPHDILESIEKVNVVARSKRSPQLIRGPYNANKQSRYVELVLVVDNKLYEGMNKNLEAVHNHCKDIANIINALFVPLNIFIALVGVVVWTEFDEITLSTKGDTTLTNFLHYRRETLVKQQANDNAQLLTRVQFEGGVVGKALKGPICTYEFSGGVSMDHSPVVGLVATTVAHEMGHNFGMEHDAPSCECPDDRCIMAASSSNTRPTHWSSCSLSYLASAFEHGMDYCLRNKPERLFDSPVCGNGFVEPGEQCDCGLKDRCDNPCCNASTCMLHSNASCATGECCDLSTCHPKTAGSMCRSADHECDLPEYCTGESEYCPNDVFKMDGDTCLNGRAFCYKGSCRSHTDQCRMLWGPSGKSSDMKCYHMNTKGSRHGNCGYNRLNQSYIKCYDEHIYCGMLHCMHLSEKLEFGMESVAILSHSFINKQGSVIPCRTAIVDLGLNEVDPGLAPDGAKCAEGKMCVGQRCLPVGSLMADAKCRNNCNGNGVCNSLGHCHCNTGFAPPDCHNPGTGGSEDSGPASQPNARREVITAFYIVFLGIVPGIAIVSFFIYYAKRQPVVRRKPRTTILDKKAHHHHHHGGGAGGVRGPPPPISGPLNLDHSLLLPPRGDDSSSGDLHNNLLGQFVGFSITPIQHSQTQKLPESPKTSPIRPAPKVPLHQQELRPAPEPPSQPEIHQRPRPLQNSANIQKPISPEPSSLIPSRPAPIPPVAMVQSDPLINPSQEKKNVPALTRIASFMKNQKPEKVDKRSKFDKETLRGLEISAPIPQDASSPVQSVPVAAEKVQRVQSMRETVVAKRPQLPSFGSMRVGNSANKRPASIPAAIRPTSPPPPRPPSASINHDYDDCLAKGSSTSSSLQYDDCLTLATEAVAPLAHIDEESPRENIYAVIEEGPLSELKLPCTSNDSNGLLGEIVTEIEARNTESIYSASTLKRKKDKDKDESGSSGTTEKSSDTYINTSWKSDSTQKSSTSSNSSNSGYLSPINNVNPSPPDGAKSLSKTGPTVPEASAPYKPYTSSIVRSSGPYLASANTSKLETTPKIDVKAPIKRTKTPPSLVVHKKTPVLSVAPMKNQKPTTNGKPLAKPDLVSSCEASQSPDIINKSGPTANVKPPVAKRKPTLPNPKSASKVASLQAKFENGKKDSAEKVTINR